MLDRRYLVPILFNIYKLPGVMQANGLPIIAIKQRYLLSLYWLMYIFSVTNQDYISSYTCSQAPMTIDKKNVKRWLTYWDLRNLSKLGYITKIPTGVGKVFRGTTYRVEVKTILLFNAIQKEYEKFAVDIYDQATGKFAMLNPKNQDSQNILKSLPKNVINWLNVGKIENDILQPYL